MPRSLAFTSSPGQSEVTLSPRETDGGVLCTGLWVREGGWQGGPSSQGHRRITRGHTPPPSQQLEVTAISNAHR